jgi:hypothetical protein
MPAPFCMLLVFFLFFCHVVTQEFFSNAGTMLVGIFAHEN